MTFDTKTASFSSVAVNGCELLQSPCPLFTVSFIQKNGERTQYDACDASAVSFENNELIFEFGNENFTVHVSGFGEQDDGFRISVSELPNKCLEWVDFPRMILKPLCDNGGIGKMVLPYNEGVLVTDDCVREASEAFRHYESGYPSQGCYAVFPNMLFAQFTAYLTDCGGLYFGHHDEMRGVKQIDFYPQNGGIAIQNKVYTGVRYEESYEQSYPIVIKACGTSWQDAADVYANWLQVHIPQNLPKIAENTKLPEWYSDSPLVISYPVRGIHDMDEMNPNALYPYVNALPLVRKIADEVNSRLLVLLMHWEGTAPWAPPYVWPPYGGADNFIKFKEELHKNNHLLGVYCSGFGYTMQSNLTDYSGAEAYVQNHFETGMCAGPDGNVAISMICTGQRRGYDVCPASETGKRILCDAYEPLFNAGIDYAQILDQNHGGGQYFCYSREHGHPHVPGPWMTKNMQDMLGNWNDKAGKMLLGCESAAAEPFMPNLLFSDNRFELNYDIGQAIPLYAYLYHEYVRNFMGNQVSCPFSHHELTLPFRLAYSFTAGDAMTLVLTPNGELMTNWGDHDFTDLPDYQTVISFVGTLQKFYKEKAGKWLFDGKMIKTPAYETEKVIFHHRNGREIPVDAVLSTAWDKDGDKVQIFVNHTPDEQIVTMSDGNALVLKPYSAQMISII